MASLGLDVYDAQGNLIENTSRFKESNKVQNGNAMLWNYGLNPAVGFNFILRVEGLFDVPCRAVREFKKENEFEIIQEGGLNDYVHMRRKPISKPFTFQVERYVGVDGLVFDPLALGTDLILPLILLVNRYHWIPKYPYPTRTYTFTGCTVIDKTYGRLDAEKSDLLVETTTIAYRELLNVDIGIQSNSMKPWNFSDSQKDTKEAKKRRHAKRNEDELRKDKMPGRKWEFPGTEAEKKKIEAYAKAKGIEDLSTIKYEDLPFVSAQRRPATPSERRKWPWPGSEEEKEFINQYKKKLEEQEKDTSALQYEDYPFVSAQRRKATAAEGRKWPETKSAVNIAEFLKKK